MISPGTNLSTPANLVTSTKIVPVQKFHEIKGVYTAKIRIFSTWAPDGSQPLMTGSDDLSVEGTNIRYNKFSRRMGRLHRHKEETKKEDCGTE